MPERPNPSSNPYSARGLKRTSPDRIMRQPPSGRPKAWDRVLVGRCEEALCLAQDEISEPFAGSPGAASKPQCAKLLRHRSGGVGPRHAFGRPQAREQRLKLDQ